MPNSTDKVMQDAKQIITSAEQIAELLERTVWANDFSFVQLQKIVENMKAYEIPRDTIVFLEGTADQAMGIIITGEVKIIKIDQAEQKTLAVLGPGNTFGEMSMIDGEPRSARIVAAAKSIILFITKDDFLKLGETWPGLGLKIMWKIARLMSQRLRRTDSLLMEHLND